MSFPRYSLRWLLGVVATALLAALARPWGAPAVVGAVFVSLGAAPLALGSLSARWAYLVAWQAVYAPFVALALFLTIFVPCAHCKASGWIVLPAGPGLAVYHIVRSWLRIGAGDDALQLGGSMLISMLVVAALTLIGLKAPRWNWAPAIVVLLLSGLAAFGTFALIRS